MIKTFENPYMNSSVEYSNPDKENLVKFCSKCGCSDFHELVIDRIDYTETEREIRCNDCDKLVNYWGYGNYDNFNFIDDNYRKMQRQKKLERIVNEKR